MYTVQEMGYMTIRQGEREIWNLHDITYVGVPVLAPNRKKN